MTLSVNLWRGPEILMTEWELGCAEGLVLAEYLLLTLLWRSIPFKS